MTEHIFSLDHLLKPLQEASQKQSKPVETTKTLETYHTQQLVKLREEKDRLQEYKQELASKRDRLSAVEHELSSPSLITQAADITTLTSQHTLEREIRELEDKIAHIESGSHEADYFLRVGDILFSYSDAQERIASGERPSDKSPVKKSRIPANSVYSYFSSNAEEPIESTPVAEQSAVKQEHKRATDVVNDIGFKRDKALESYLSALNPDSLQHENAIASSIAEDYGNCPMCDSEMFMNDTYLDCPGCGFRDFILVDSEKPSYKDPPREMSYYAYKKINHLNEWLAQFQAKETTEISQAVLDQIRAELRKERITDMSKLKQSKLKEVIKKLKLVRCYDHAAHILNRLNGISAPVLSREIEEKLRFMFKEIQFSFVKHCPKKRSNFLSYSYVLYKFCELLELDEYLPCFPLLKSREKLYMQDKIWQKICEDMGWEFIRTV
jgi:hypothetical protein